MKKIILFLGIISSINSLSFSQILIEKEVLTKDKWKRVLKSKLGITPYGECIHFEFSKNDLPLPTEWCFEDDICQSCEYLYCPLTKTVFLIIMPHSAPIGTYLFYFDIKNEKSWCQINSSIDSLSVLKYTPELYGVKLYSYNELNDLLNIRYVFFNQLSGVLLNKTIDLNNDLLINKSFDKSLNEISFSLNDSLITIDYSKMAIVDSLLWTNSIFLNTTYYSPVSRIKRKHNKG